MEFSLFLTKRYHNWLNWKQELTKRSGIWQHEHDNEQYIIWFYDGPEIHITNIWLNTVPNDIIQNGYTQEQNDSDKLDWETSYQINSNNSIEKRQTNNKALLVANAGREGNETIYASHNFCDKTTWFQDSGRKEFETLSGSGTVFTATEQNWICMDRGRVLDEEGWKEDVSHGYQVIVVANDVTKSQCDPFTGTDGDYIVDYETGQITFNSESYSAENVKASYSYARSSIFSIAPTPYKKLDIEEVEAQFTKDVIINDSFVFGVFGYVQVFAPEYWEGNGGPLPTNYKIELKRQTYATLTQLIDEALGSYPIIPALGGSSRGLSNDMYGFPFRYGTIRSLYNSYGLETRVWLKNHNACGGERVTATFYCISSNEDPA